MHPAEAALMMLLMMMTMMMMVVGEIAALHPQVHALLL